MKIEIDFDRKTITLKDSVPLKELVDKLKGLELGDWNGWTIKVEHTTEYIPTTPWTIPTPYYPPVSPYVYPSPTTNPPFELPWTITCSAK